MNEAKHFGAEYLDAAEPMVAHGGEMAGGIGINPIGITGVPAGLRFHIIAP